MEISVIIPVYNVEKYLNQCLETVAGQSYRDFEVLMINDGSTDKSEQVCNEWAIKDKRFKLYSKENEGPSLTRNYGIRKAEGRYIAFVDADDWLDRDYLKLLYEKIITEDADIVECDVYRVNNNTGKKTVKVCWGAVGKEYNKEERIKRGYTAIWRCLYKKTLWIDNQIEFPDCHSQARGVYALLVALANKVVCVRKPLYYYRKFRENSLSAKPRGNAVDFNAEGIQAYRCLIDGFKKRGLFSKYRDTLRRMLHIKSSESLAGLYPLRGKDDFLELRNNYRTFLRELFPHNREISYITFGGYNLNVILRDMDQLNDPYLRFNFSSIISVMHPVDGLDISHKNKYRQIMVRRDIASLFWDIIKEEKEEYLILDFTEERFDILEVDGGYLTKTDAFDDAVVSVTGRVISRLSEECDALWKKECLNFINRLRCYIPSEHIILVKSYLSERHGDLTGCVDFEDKNEIVKINKKLKYYYDFFECNCEKCKSVDTSRLKNYFTDDGYEYGAVPSHLNEVVNRNIADLISQKICE